jgi:hypothetical protein
MLASTKHHFQAPLPTTLYLAALLSLINAYPTLGKEFCSDTTTERIEAMTVELDLFSMF